MNRRNSMTSTYLWLLCSTSVVPAVLFWDRSAPLAVALLLFVVGYVVLYWRIVRFKSPRWLRPGRMARTVVKRDNPVT
jgi:cytochrome c biogenesis protein CcdA